MSETTQPAADMVVDSTMPDLAAPTDAELGAGTQESFGQESAPEPELSDAPQAPEAPERPDNRQVPLAALKEARAESKRLREEQAQFRATVEQRLQALQAAAAPKPEAPQVPEFDADPAMHLKHRLDQQDQVLQQTQQERQAQVQQQQIQAAYSAAAQQFSATAPDFGPAYQHAVSHLAALAPIVGVPLEVLEREVVVNAIRAQRNPAEAMYQLAKATGFTGPKPVESPLASMQRGQAATRSAGGSGAPPAASQGGAAAMATISLDELVSMPDAEWAKRMRG